MGGWGGGDVDSADFLCGAVMETLGKVGGVGGGGGRDVHSADFRCVVHFHCCPLVSVPTYVGVHLAIVASHLLASEIC